MHKFIDRPRLFGPALMRWGVIYALLLALAAVARSAA